MANFQPRIKKRKIQNRLQGLRIESGNSNDFFGWLAQHTKLLIESELFHDSENHIELSCRRTFGIGWQQSRKGTGIELRLAQSGFIECRVDLEPVKSKNGSGHVVHR